jgi:hypothetical protein
LVEVRRDRRADARSRAYDHDLPSLAAHSTNPSRHLTSPSYHRTDDSKVDSKQFWFTRQSLEEWS